MYAPLHIPKRSPLFGVICVLFLSIFGGNGDTHAGSNDAASAGFSSPDIALAEEEVARRTALYEKALNAIIEGEEHLAAEDWDNALSSFHRAIASTSPAPGTKSIRERALSRTAQAAVRKGRTLAAVGRYDEARALLEPLTEGIYAPFSDDVVRLLEEMEDPERYNPALSHEGLLEIQQVTELLLSARDLVDVGRYDDARVVYQETLRIDRTNSAARKGLERVDHLRAEYYNGAARMQTRAQALADVAEGHVSQVPPTDNITALFGGDANPDTVVALARKTINVKLEQIRIPKVEFTDATLDEVLQYLGNRSRELDTLGDEGSRGISMVIKGDPSYRERTINLNVSNLPLGEVLRYAADQAGMRYEIEEFAVALFPIDQRSTTLITRTFRVPPGFIESDAVNIGGLEEVDPFAPAPATGGSLLGSKRLTAQEFLERQGVIFPEGAAANYSPTTGILSVRNTFENINYVEGMVEEALASSPRQVKVRVTIMEVRQNDLAEIGFDWLVSPSNIHGSERLFAGGGTIGDQLQTDTQGIAGNFVDPNGTQVGTNPITAGLRSTSSLREGATIDEILAGFSRTNADNSSRSPSAFNVSGVFTDPQFQTMIRMLDQSKALDILSAPTVVTKSGQRAQITVGREFPYATEWDPPEIPDGGAPDNDALGLALGGPGFTLLFATEFLPITPATPTSFEYRNIGYQLEVEPVIGADNYTIELSLTPEFVEFQGFINYGQQFTTPGLSADDIALSSDGIDSASLNQILQPLFRTNKATVNVTVYDGLTLAIAGHIGEATRSINDKIPGYGDVPILGNLFRSDVIRSERSHVVMFVTANILDPSGQRLNKLEGVAGANPPR